jgi:hypothetical protein
MAKPIPDAAMRLAELLSPFREPVAVGCIGGCCHRRAGVLYDSTCRLCNLCMCSMADMWDVVTGWVSLCVVECLPSQAKERLL